VGLEEIATATSPRHYTSARGYSTGPWDRLDQDVDERSSKILQSSGNTHQSWSKYMGTEEDGDDSPWASLDAIADGAKDLAKAVPEQQPGIPTKQADYSTDWETAAIAAAEAFASTQSDKAVRSAAEMSEPRLTHINPRDDRASMVDVSSKDVTTRTAQAEARVYFPDVVLQLLNGEEIEKSNARRKGSVLQTAQLAGIMGAKRTSELIPLCHGLNLSHVDVELQVHSSGEVQELPHFILIRCTAKTTSQTGVEMEALTGASIAALTVWDMLKSVGGQQMRIDGLMVTSKSGGKSGSWTRRPKSTIV
jgi:molybdenum cofactor biosynthesis protein MoaC